MLEAAEPLGLCALGELGLAWKCSADGEDGEDD
jgi:hypothetical protein